MSRLPLIQPPAVMRSWMRKGNWSFRDDFNTTAINSCSIPNISLTQQWLPSSVQCCTGAFAWVQEKMEQGRCILHWGDSADLQSCVSSRLFCAIQDMSYVLFFSSAEFINCSWFIAGSFKDIEGTYELQPVKSKCMGQPCQAGNFPAPSPSGFYASHLWGFFSVQIISPCLRCTLGYPWVSPVAEKEETPSLARTLYPKHSPGCHPSPHQSTHRHFKAAKAEVTDPNDIPSFPCTALVTGCMIKQKSSPWAGSAAQLCREGLQTAWAIWVRADVLLLSLGPSTQLQNHSGTWKELLEGQTAFKDCDQQESSAIHRPNPFPK